MSTPDSNLLDKERLEDALQLVSRQMDGDLAPEDEIRLTALESEFPRDLAKFRRECSRLQNLLRSIPVSPIGDSFSLNENPSLLIADRKRSEKRFNLKWRTALGSVGTIVLASCLLVAVMKLLNGPGESGQEMSMAHNDTLMPGTASHVTDESSMRMRRVPEAAFAEELINLPAAGMAIEPANDSVRSVAEAEEIRPFLQTENWNIVVLKVNSTDRTAAMEQIQAIVSSNGLRVPGFSENSRDDDSAWLGVVLTSAPVSNRKFIDDVIDQGVAESIEWDHRQIADASPEELIAAVRRSLQFPTKSELYHGEVYVAVSQSESPQRTLVGNASPAVEMASSEPVRTKTVESTVEAPTVSSEDSVGQSTTGESPAGKLSEVTLVVFQFPSGDDAANNGEPEGRI